MNPTTSSNTRFITSEELDDLGYSDLTEEQKSAILAAAYDALSTRVGEELSANLTSQQMTEFGRILSQPNADQNSFYWFLQNLPTHQQVVARQLVHLKEELAKIISEFDTYFPPEQEPTHSLSRSSPGLDGHHKASADA